MNKTELVAAIAETTKLTKKDSEKRAERRAGYHFRGPEER